MELIIAFVLGAGTIMAGKRGSRLLKDAVGWTARRTGYFSKHASLALDAARRMARQEFARGHDSSDPIVIDIDVAPSAAGHDGAQNGAPSNGVPSNGVPIPTTGVVR
jgi:hypothetical protein